MKKILTLSVLLRLFGRCQKEDITRTGIIKDHFYFENRDATMPVYVEGNISSNKILIIIHGGPGDGALYFNTPEASAIAEKEFAIAYWDQRAAGISQSNTVSLEHTDYIDDLKKLIALLRYQYGAEKKIYLLAHSWGGLIAPLFLEDGTNQNLVSGWIQVDGTHNYPLNDSLTRASLTSFGSQEIDAGRHTEDWQEIVNYCVQHDPQGNYDVARKMNNYANNTDDYIPQINKPKSRVGYFIKNYDYPITTYLTNGVYNNLIKKLEKQAYAEHVSRKLNTITIPTLLLWGKYDFVCPAGLGEDIARRVSSQDVQTMVFEHSGHSPMQNQPTEFWDAVTRWMYLH